MAESPRKERRQSEYAYPRGLNFDRSMTAQLRKGLSRASELRFGVHSHNVKILSSPCEFYDAVLAGIGRARSNITLASLYLGNGPKEEKLIE